MSSRNVQKYARNCLWFSAAPCLAFCIPEKIILVMCAKTVYSFRWTTVQKQQTSIASSMFLKYTKPKPLDFPNCRNKKEITDEIGYIYLQLTNILYYGGEKGYHLKENIAYFKVNVQIC